MGSQFLPRGLGIPTLGEGESCLRKAGVGRVELASSFRGKIASKVERCKDSGFLFSKTSFVSHLLRIQNPFPKKSCLL